MLRIILQRSLILIAATSVMSLQAGYYVFTNQTTETTTVIEKKLERRAIFDPGRRNPETLTTTSTTEENTVQLGDHAGQFGADRGLDIVINEGREAGLLQFDETIGIPARLAETCYTAPSLQRFRLLIYQRLAYLSQQFSPDNPDFKPRNCDMLLPSGPFTTGSIATTGLLRVADVARDGEAMNRFNIVGYLPFFLPNQRHKIFVRVNINIALDEEDRTTSFTMRRAGDDEQQEIGDFQLTLNGIDETTRTSAVCREVMQGRTRIPPMGAHVAESRESVLSGTAPQDSTPETVLESTTLVPGAILFQGSN